VSDQYGIIRLLRQALCHLDMRQGFAWLPETLQGGQSQAQPAMLGSVYTLRIG
jgi:hypothetical protein